MIKSQDPRCYESDPTTEILPHQRTGSAAAEGELAKKSPPFRPVDPTGWGPLPPGPLSPDSGALLLVSFSVRGQVR